jgi:hypothetical protein
MRGIAMNESGYQIADLEEGRIPAVPGICRTELGTDYRSEADFRKCLDRGTGNYCKVLLDGEGAPAGFSISMIMGPDSADDYFRLPASAERDRVLSFRRIGILDAAAVDHSRKGRGMGRLLARASCGKLVEEGAEVICSMAWKDINGVTNARKLLVENGLEATLEVEGYWNRVVDSPEGHHCPLCGTPPCRCFGVLYTRNIKPG